MKLKDLYLEAARRVAEEEDIYSCVAVQKAKRTRSCLKHVPEVARYDAIFHDGPIFEPTEEWVCMLASFHFDSKRAGLLRNLRVLMLCLMAECWKDFR